MDFILYLNSNLLVLYYTLVPVSSEDPVERLSPALTSEEDFAMPALMEKASNQSEQTINKQPVTYMSVREVISSAKSIDIQTALVRVCIDIHKCICHVQRIYEELFSI